MQKCGLISLLPLTCSTALFLLCTHSSTGQNRAVQAATMAGTDSSQGSSTPGMTLLVIKNPTRSDGFPLEVALDATVREVQGLIAQTYPGNPAIDEQTVSGRGRATHARLPQLGLSLTVAVMQQHFLGSLGAWSGPGGRANVFWLW
jgi:hypothetical protein